MSIFRRALDSAYARERDLESGLDARLSDSQLFGFVWEKLLQRMRGIARGFPRSFISSAVQIRGRSALTLAHGTALGTGAIVDARSIHGIHIGTASTVDRHATIRASGVMRNLGHGVRIGERTAIGLGNFIHGGGGVAIGNDCLLGPYVSIVSENHVFADAVRPIRDQGEIRAAITIEDDVWIGAGASVLAGVRIERGAVVAAGAVVVSDVAAGSIVGGVPAKVIGQRGSGTPAHREKPI